MDCVTYERVCGQILCCQLVVVSWKSIEIYVKFRSTYCVEAFTTLESRVPERKNIVVICPISKKRGLNDKQYAVKFASQWSRFLIPDLIIFKTLIRLSEKGCWIFLINKCEDVFSSNGKCSIDKYSGCQLPPGLQCDKDQQFQILQRQKIKATPHEITWHHSSRAQLVETFVKVGIVPYPVCEVQCRVTSSSRG